MTVKWYDYVAFVVCVIIAWILNYVVTTCGWDDTAICTCGIVLGIYLLNYVFKESKDVEE